jgi:SAM-dependent methyltransferase
VDRLLRATADAEARHFWYRGFRDFVTPLLYTATSGRSDARILDCGCGTGNNLELLSRFGRAYGFDLTETGLRIGLEAGRRRLARATVTAVPFSSNVFDVVTSFDVLYALHEPDARVAVGEMYRITRPSGYLILNVAAMDILRGDHSVLGGEVQRFTRERLTQLIAGAGFSIERITYTNAVLFLPMLAVRTAQRWRGLKPEAESGGDFHVPPAPVNAALACALRLESLWLRVGTNPFGSSLLCLARKPDGARTHR